MGLNFFAIVAPQLALNTLGVYLLGAKLFLPILGICYAAVIARKIITLRTVYNFISLLESKPLQNYKKLNNAKQKMLTSFVAEMSHKLKMTPPDIYYDAEDKAVKAGMLTIGLGKYRIELSKGLIKAFERDEIDEKTFKAILAHELSHGYNHDTFLSNCLSIVASINYAYSYLALGALLVLTCTLGAATLFSSLSLSLPAFLVTSGKLFAIAALAPFTYFCSKSVDRAMEFRADLTAAELTKDAPTVARIGDSLGQILAKWGYQIHKDMFGYKAVSLPFTRLLGVNYDLLVRYLRENDAKLKRQKSQPARWRKFNKIRNELRSYVKNLYQNDSVSPVSNGNVRRKIDKLLHALLTPAQRQTLISVGPAKTKLLPITPWYDLKYWDACLQSFEATHPCSEAREAVVLEVAKNKVSMSSK